MMKKMFILLLLCASAILAQGHKVTFPNSADYIEISDGDTLIVTQPKLFVFGQSGYEKLAGSFIKEDTLATLYKLNQSISDSLSLMQKSVISHLNKIISIQSTAYDSLLHSFNQAGLLVDKSTANTERALQHIKTLKLMSYTSGTILGGVAGGMAGGQLHDKDHFNFSWTGAAVGAVSGFLLNRYLLNLF